MQASHMYRPFLTIFRDVFGKEETQHWLIIHWWEIIQLKQKLKLFFFVKYLSEMAEKNKSLGGLLYNYLLLYLTVHVLEWTLWI
jgi:hypothetical protein